MGKEESVALDHCQELMEIVETIEDKLHQLEVIRSNFVKKFSTKLITARLYLRSAFLSLS